MIQRTQQLKLVAILLFCSLIPSCMLFELNPLAPTYGDARLLSGKNSQKNSPDTDRLLESIFTNLTNEYNYNKNTSNFNTYSTIVLKATEKLKKLNYAGYQSATIPTAFCDTASSIVCPDDSDVYRSFDGSCNNKNKKWYGKTNTPQKRILKPFYDDGISSMRQVSYVPGYSLPHPRILSYTLNRPNPTKSVWTNYFITFGQTIAHDLVHTKQSTGGSTDDTTATCDCQKLDSNNKDCISLPVYSYDYYMRSKNSNCISFLRSQASIVDFDCNLGPREQLNAYSSWLDLGFVYGLGYDVVSDPENPHLLKTSINAAGEQTFPVIEGTACEFANKFPKYLTSDKNGEQNVYQQSSQVIWVRNHNYIAAKLKADTRTSTWGDKKIFQEARRINIALYQHAIYNEYLPNSLGIYTTKKYSLWPLTWGYYYGYNSDVYPQIYNEFAAAGFRHHTMVGNQQCKADKNFYITQCEQISSGMLDSNQACKSLDEVARGQLATQSYYSTPQVSWVMNNWLLRQTDSIGVKNILRGRDHGIRGYVFYRAWCGLGQARTFDDLIEIPYSVRNELRKLYYHVNDVDLWVGGISELPIKDALIGPTFACIVGRQFAELKRGDRFYYENGQDSASKFTPDQLTSIRGTFLASVLCKNLNINSVPKWPFLYPHQKLNPFVDCSRFGDYNLEPFINPATAAATTYNQNYPNKNVS